MSYEKRYPEVTYTNASQGLLELLGGFCIVVHNQFPDFLICPPLSQLKNYVG
jgi:hypothetical protein